MKRIFASAILLLTVAPLAAVAGPLAAQAQGKHCHVHGYSHAYCQVVEEGHWVGYHVPQFKHHQLEVYVRHFWEVSIDIEIEKVACPVATPAGAICFGMDLFNSKTGKPIYHVRNIGFSRPTWKYNASLGKWQRVHGTHSGGLFYFMP